MSEMFVPFFSKPASEKNVPQYQFQQYNLSRVTLAQPARQTPVVPREELKKKS